MAARKRKKANNKKKLPRVSLFFRLISAVKRLLKHRHALTAIAIMIFSFLIYNSKALNSLGKSIHQKYEAFSQHYGLVFKDIYLEGQQHSSLEEIHQAIAHIQHGAPLSHIDLHHIKEKIEALDWVEFAVVERAYPSTLTIRMVERKATALWQHQGKVQLIDQYGKVIPANINHFSELILLVGENAHIYAPHLLQTLYQSPKLFSQIVSAVRVGGRRWNLRFKNNLLVKMPEDNTEAAWQDLVEKYQETLLYGKDVSQIDYRLWREKIFIK